tara:strand:+ start:2002 stop:2724 length:723 start_codon:yes stop_codon:yes gene_type:complete
MTNFWDSEFPTGYYDKVFQQGLLEDKGIQTNWHNLTFKKIKSYLFKSIDHLDYACGPGTFIGNFSEANSVGVDLAKKQINYAKEKYSNKFKFYDLIEFESKYETEKFDLITVLGLFEFLSYEDMIETLNFLYDKLKPKGRLILTTPNFNNLQFRILLLILNIFSNTGYRDQHINKLNKKKIRKIIKKTKFQEINKIYKFLNFGIAFSVFSIRSGEVFNNFIERLFSNNYGYLILCVLEKK